ncbi:MAG TPA: ribosome-associated translation inhibitor RaiA [Bacteroidales bacterium]|jgi:ribosomal subunit interface protein|nr:ribosome-associated translation inhibitor RaiA [Bacteroidales bacterium]OQB64526.1 MAG: Sigma 54 modulation protein / S30EA ribosomal protein [Bacteroidetes bacterium ADurb.Bin145]NMD03363.1 ribosome-associated translation inhibitor RaiA [Bacteroidales bacterium]HOU01019.1 ribosome-associated translation inhibitor RaiA [Bacteroidales bacterium]HQG62210.1 ribosome-associated translation inhibitor RaiA [Bacteroidales bacterium]
MKIQINSDKNIQITERFEKYFSEKINLALKRFEDNITRIEIHLSDQNARKTGPDDLQCKIEARLKDLKPVIATGKSNTKEKALDEALKKMKASLDKVTGKLKAK